MRRRTKWAVLLSSVLLGVPLLGCNQGRPNVLLVTVDTLRADHLHCYGFPAETSPSIDALAARGVLFERAIAASGYTGPSHAAIMSSKYPRHASMGYSNGQLRLTDTPTLADIFRAAGYRTGAFVSNDVLARRSGLDFGFQTYDDELPDAEPNRPGVFERIAEKTTRAAVAWLQTTSSNPFFLWVHYQDPHGPYTPPPPYRDQFHLPAEGQPALEFHDDESGFGGVPHYQHIDGVVHLADYESRYAGEIAYADHWIGALLDAAREQSGDAPLVVLLTADHGEAFGEDQVYLAHGHATSPELSHVPLILVVPGHVGERRDEIVSQVDVMPTLLEAAGIALPRDVDGIALTSTLTRPARARTVFCDIGYEVSAYREGEFLRAGFAQAKTWDLAMSYQSGHGLPPGPDDLRREQTFRWDGGPTWSPTRSNALLRHDLLGYVSTSARPAGTAPSDARQSSSSAQPRAERLPSSDDEHT